MSLEHPEQNNQLEDKKKEEKQVLLDKAMEQLDQETDRLGKPIDGGIKETVAAFMVNGFPTNGSCEGHVEERFNKKVKLCPYIDIGFDAPEQRFIGEHEIKEKIASKLGITPEELRRNEEAEREYWDYIQNNDVPETQEFLEVRVKNEELQNQMSRLLEDFYKNRQVSEDAKLFIEGIGPAGYFRVTTAKENPKEIKESEITQYQKRLSSEQQEMLAFAEFLKKK